MAFETYEADAIEWLQSSQASSIHAVVTDPPYGAREYDRDQMQKMQSGSGGVWRIPPKIGGCERAPVPRFTVLSDADKKRVRDHFFAVGTASRHALVPGGHMVVAANPLVAPVVFGALAEAGLENRGQIVRLVRTLRGGDRPKGAEAEFSDVSVMPRSCWEPWGLFRAPMGEKTVAENLRRWGTGGLRREPDGTPFLDVIPSGRTPQSERALAAHPSLKPQAFLRRICRAVLPLGTGRICDPYMGSGSTLAACEALGIDSVGVDRDPAFVALARNAIPRLAAVVVRGEEDQDD